MHSLARKIPPTLPLRLGLGAMYLYSGYDLMVHPSSWTWAIPSWFSALVTSFMPLEHYLSFQGAVELVLAGIFLLWFLPRKLVAVAAAFSSLELAGILLLAPSSQFLITFRDLGVLGASLALFLLMFRNHGRTK